jgi:epoxyqueuosine reductase
LDTATCHEITEWIKVKAEELGFSACGIVEATFLENEAERLDQWLLNGYHGEMHYMAANRDKRLDPGILLPGSRSVISVLMNYFPAENPPVENNYKIAKYAYGKDYHPVIRERLNLLISGLKELAGDIQAQAFTDSAPVLEKAWAEKAGLGWIGKNTCLIHPKLGSFVFIGEIITDLELEYDRRQINDLCGGCTRCIDACPTGAILAPRLLDARKCISYLTIEFRGEIPQHEKDNFNDWIFGCDICQDVCPWNRKVEPHRENSFQPAQGMLEMDKEKWEQLTEDQFRDLFRESAVKRTKFVGLKRNIFFLKDQGRSS